jgi:hypothetical protein
LKERSKELLPGGACCRRLRDSQLKVFCFFSSEKKTFFFLLLMLITENRHHDRASRRPSARMARAAEERINHECMKTRRLHEEKA